MVITIKPVDATAEIMAFLEDKGVIRRLLPGRDRLKVEPGDSKWREIYAAQDRFGPHKLIAVTINREQPQALAYHSDAEDFMLIDSPDAADLILTVALVPYDKLQEKIRENTVSQEDFMALRCRANDPLTSFFTMNPYYAHVETCGHVSDCPPSFYVAESRHLDENAIDFKGYQLIIQNQKEATP